METALFCLGLDDEHADARAAADLLLHGNSGNRWFDKAVSLIVFADGSAGINGEHCKLDGTPIVAFIDEILDSPAEPRTGAGAPPVWAPLDFVLDADLRADVAAAGDAFAVYAADTASATLRIDEFTGETAKQLKMSPDAFAQMSFQLAHRRAKGHLGATYESIAMRQYHHGRTEAMRVVTPEVVRFVEAMEDPHADDGTRRAAFRAAAEKHVERARECQAGQAPEQHLWELQLIAQRRGSELGVTEPLPLFESPGWRTMRDDYLSTSAVPSVHVQFFGFGATSHRCIGIGYAMLPDRFDLYLTTPRSVSEPMAVFARELPRAVRELERLLRSDDTR